MKPLRVGYLSDCDPRDRWAWSGTHFHMLQALLASGLDVTPLHTAASRPSLPERIWRRLSGAGSPKEAANLALPGVTRDSRDSCDVLFAPVASPLVARLERGLPVLYYSDATFSLLRRSYPEIAAIPDDVAVRREADERGALERSDRAVFASAWAARSAVDDYGVAAAHVGVVPMGANLEEIPVLATPAPIGGECRLLFVGRDWDRKGGDTALATLRELRRSGIDARLTVCGTRPSSANLDHVDVIANLDKRRPRDRRRLARLFADAHFLVFPSRAECFGMVCAEAGAFATPVIASDTGGIPVFDGENGRRVALGDGAAGFAAAIVAAWRDPDAYQRLARGAREMYDRTLNWTAWGRAIRDDLETLAAHSPRGARS